VRVGGRVHADARRAGSSRSGCRASRAATWSASTTPAPTR
jgi:hypothetical protein